MYVTAMYGLSTRVNNREENLRLDAVVTSTSGLAIIDSVYYGYTGKWNYDILSSIA